MEDIYSKETIKEMQKLEYRGYFKSLFSIDEIPDDNRLVLLYMKIKECEKIATQKILDEATKRKELLNDQI